MSISPEMSASTVSKSTSASSGSTLLTSMSLTALGAGLCAPRRGVVGVFGLDCVPSVGVRRAGDVAAERGLETVRCLDSVVSAALYFLVELSILGVEGMGRRVTSSVEDVAERGRRGVNGIARASLLGVGGTDMVVLVSLVALLVAVGVLEVVVVDVDRMQLQRALRLLDEPCETDGIDATRNATTAF